MAPRVGELVSGVLEHEVIRESVAIAIHSTDKGFRFDGVQGGEVGIEHDVQTAQSDDRVLDALELDQELVRHGVRDHGMGQRLRAGA